MPNWCEGTFRARGSKEDLINFIRNGVEAEFIPMDCDDEFETEKCGYIWIKDTRRHFLNAEDRQYISLYEKENGIYQFAFPFVAAWAIDTDAIKMIAEKYHIDVRVNGFEMGMQFEQLVEVSKTGWIRCDSVIQYDDYEWQCAMPLLGG